MNTERNNKIAVSVPSVDIWKSAFEKQYPDLAVEFVEPGGSFSKDVTVIITFYALTEQQLDPLNDLKLVLIPYTGVNSQPLEYLSERGIMICNSHASARFVAEKGFSLALALLGRVVELDQQFRKGWQALDDRGWPTLFHKKVGILGMGEIGQELYQLLKPFHIELVTLKRYERYGLGHDGITYVDTIEDVCDRSDVLFNVLPLTNHTRGIIHADHFNRLKDKYVINVGRGETMDEEAFYEALRNGVLKGAASDVWYTYDAEYPSRYPFHELPNVVMSPHNGGLNVDSVYLAINDTFLNLQNYLTGAPMRNVVTTKGY